MDLVTDTFYLQKSADQGKTPEKIKGIFSPLLITLLKSLRK